MALTKCLECFTYRPHTQKKKQQKKQKQNRFVKVLILFVTSVSIVKENNSTY